MSPWTATPCWNGLPVRAESSSDKGCSSESLIEQNKQTDDNDDDKSLIKSSKSSLKALLTSPSEIFVAPRKSFPYLSSSKRTTKSDDTFTSSNDMPMKVKVSLNSGLFVLWAILDFCQRVCLNVLSGVMMFTLQKGSESPWESIGGKSRARSSVQKSVSCDSS